MSMPRHQSRTEIFRSPNAEMFSRHEEESMSGKFAVGLTCAKDDTDKATVAFVVANAAVASAFVVCGRAKLSPRGMRRDGSFDGRVS